LRGEKNRFTAPKTLAQRDAHPFSPETKKTLYFFLKKESGKGDSPSPTRGVTSPRSKEGGSKRGELLGGKEDISFFKGKRDHGGEKE